MSKKLTSIVMALLILMQVAVAPLGAVSAATESDAPTTATEKSAVVPAAETDKAASKPAVVVPASDSMAGKEAVNSVDATSSKQVGGSSADTPTSVVPVKDEEAENEIVPTDDNAMKANTYAGKVTGGIIFVDPKQQNGLALGDVAVLYAKIDAETENFVGGTAKVVLPKDYFVQPKEEDVTAESNSLGGIKLSVDKDNYYIEFNLKTVYSGAQVALPFSVRLSNPNDNSKKAVVTEVITDSTGKEFSQ